MCFEPPLPFSLPMWMLGCTSALRSETWLITNYMYSVCSRYTVSVCCGWRLHMTLPVSTTSSLPPARGSLHPTVRPDRAVHSTRDDDVDLMNCIGSCQCRYGIMEWTSVSHSILIWFTRLPCFLGSQDAAGSAKVEENKVNITGQHVLLLVVGGKIRYRGPETRRRGCD